jgi:hypothetical protein
MNIPLFLVGLLSMLIGLVLTVVQTKGSVRASTQFGDFSGAVGPVVLVLGLVLQAISVLF